MAHFIALFKKHFIIAKRSYCSTMCEVIAPIVAVALIMTIRLAVTPSIVNQSSYFYSPPTNG